MSQRPTERSRCLRRYTARDLLAYPTHNVSTRMSNAVAKVMRAHTMSRTATAQEKKELAMPAGAELMLTRQP